MGTIQIKKYERTVTVGKGSVYKASAMRQGGTETPGGGDNQGGNDDPDDGVIS